MPHLFPKTLGSENKSGYSMCYILQIFETIT